MGLREQHDNRAKADAAFERAIAAGRLSANSGAANFAGDYMFMGTDKGRDFFKHINTRVYLPFREPDYSVGTHERLCSGGAN